MGISLMIVLIQNVTKIFDRNCIGHSFPDFLYIQGINLFWIHKYK